MDSSPPSNTSSLKFTEVHLELFKLMTVIYKSCSFLSTESIRRKRSIRLFDGPQSPLRRRFRKHSKPLTPIRSPHFKRWVTICSISLYVIQSTQITYSCHHLSLYLKKITFCFLVRKHHATHNSSSTSSGSSDDERRFERRKKKSMAFSRMR